MPYQKVLPKFKAHKLHSGSKSGPVVTNPKQAVAIMYSEKRKGLTGEADADEARMPVRKSKPTRTKR